MTTRYSNKGARGLCQWWALCENAATHTLGHPVLGRVPICERCLARLERIDAETVAAREPAPIESAR